MGTDSKYFAQIPDYLDDLLSQEEKEAFELQLTQDEQLLKEVDLHREVTKALSDPDRGQFRAKLAAINEATPLAVEEKKKQGNFFLRTLMGIAASLLLLTALGIWMLQPASSPQEQIAAYLENYDPADILPPAYTGPERNGSGDPENFSPPHEAEKNLHTARQLFSRKQYPEALAAMGSVDPERLPNPAAYWYERGVLALLNDQPQPAVDALEQINTPALENARRWHLAIAYLQLNRLDDARSVLQPLSQQPNPWQNEARSLLKNL
jgi:hypothetical protein